MIKNKFRQKRFRSKKVLAVYALCLSVIVVTMLLSIILTATSERFSIEKMIEHILLCLLAIILLNIPVIMQSRLHFRIPTYLNIIVAFFIVAHFVLGEVYRFYDYIFLFDKVLHFTSGAIISILGFSVVYGFSTRDSGTVKLSPLFVALFSFCFAMALLTLWEVFEYAMDSLFATNMQRWQDGITTAATGEAGKYLTNIPQGSGLVDTMTDLIVGMAGAIIISVVMGIVVAKFPQSTRFYITKTRIKRTRDEAEKEEICPKEKDS